MSPARSKKQFRFMKAVEAGDVKGKHAPTKKQAEEFTKDVPYKSLPEKAKKKSKKG